jgi:hypothetical protein
MVSELLRFPDSTFNPVPKQRFCSIHRPPYISGSRSVRHASPALQILQIGNIQIFFSVRIEVLAEEVGYILGTLFL